MTYKNGDMVMIVNDLFYKSNNGLHGIIHYIDTASISHLPYKVYFNTRLENGSNYEWFSSLEIEHDKNHIVQQIINDL